MGEERKKFEGFGGMEGFEEFEEFEEFEGFEKCKWIKRLQNLIVNYLNTFFIKTSGILRIKFTLNFNIFE